MTAVLSFKLLVYASSMPYMLVSIHHASYNTTYELTIHRRDRVYTCGRLGASWARVEARQKRGALPIDSNDPS